MTRRRCLRALGLGVAAAPLLSPERLLAWLGPAGPEPDAGVLLGIVRARESARILGAAYLRDHPAERDPALLLRRLGLGDAGRGDAPPARLREALGRRIRRDFAARRTVEVAGWPLARSEARLCALVALSDPSTG